MWVCETCGWENDDEADECENCSAVASSSGVFWDSGYFNMWW